VLKLPQRVTSVSFEKSTVPLIKFDVAERLRQEIVTGAIKPGSLVVEIKWAKKLGVSQGSVREALSILASEGFVQRTPGRRARVTHLTTQDINHIYQLRGAIEGLAVRLVTERAPDLGVMVTTFEEMERAVVGNDVKRLIENDLAFHLGLCQLSANPILLEHAQRLMVPLFAFAYMRVESTGQGVEPWRKTLATHARIIDYIQAGDPFLAEQFVLRSTPGFATVIYSVWTESSEGDSEAGADSTETAANE